MLQDNNLQFKNVFYKMLFIQRKHVNQHFYSHAVFLTQNAIGREIIVTHYTNKMECPLTAFTEEKVIPLSSVTLVLSV